MCLLKPSELNNNNCAHDECKNFRMLNKPACIYSFNSTGKPMLAPSQNNSNSALQNQDILAPRPANYMSNTSNEEVEDDSSFVLNKKKLKVESKNGYGVEAKPAGIQSDMNGQPMMMNGQYQQIVTGNGFDDKSLFNAPMLNNLLLSNGNNGNHNKGNDQRNNQMPVMQVAQPLYIPYMPNQMGLVDQNMQNISYIPVQQGFQQGFQPQVQNFQNMKMKPLDMNMNLQSVSTPSSAENFQKNFNMEEYMNQFQNKLSEVLVSQNKMLLDLREKNDLVQDTLACLINEVSALKQVVKQNSNENVGYIKSKASQLAQLSDNSREIASSESLLSSLYGPDHSFQYQLVFKSELPLPLYRERNFKFTVLLTDKDGNLVKNCNRIPLSLAIYTSENPPKFVDVNTSGNKILKGIIDKDMVDGAVTFDKIQIKEVTSHFRNGWVFFVVYPKTAGTVFNRATPAGNAVMVDHNQVRPLVLERVVVKAKKLKEKDAKNENENGDDNSEIDQE